MIAIIGRSAQQAMLVRIVLLFGFFVLGAGAAKAQDDYDHLRDRGPGIPVSQFGAYVDRGEWLFYPFVEYYRDHDAEYSPAELGFGLDRDFRGKYRAIEGLIFLAHAFTDRLAFELEAAVISARLYKAADDPSAVPPRIKESGLGDVEGELRWRWKKETASGPELFSYFETVFPLQRSRRLIGTQDWEFKFGTGIVRGFRWGTMTLRGAAEYDGSENVVEVGELAVEYLRRISSGAAVFLAVEGSQDEVELIPELQWFLRPGIRLKVNSAVGLTSKATDWAPEAGVMFRFR